MFVRNVGSPEGIAGLELLAGSAEMNWFLNKKIATKLITGFTVVVLLAMFLGVFCIRKLAEVQGTAELLGGSTMSGTRELGRIDAEIGTYRQWEMRLVIGMSDPRARQTAEEGLKAAVEGVKKIKVVYDPDIDNPEEKKLNEVFDAEWKTYQSTTQTLLELVRGNKSGQAVEFLNGEDGQRYQATSEAVEAIIDYQKRDADSSVKEGRELYASGRLWTIILLACCMVIGLLMGIWFARLISRPVQELREMAKQIAGGDLTGREIEIRSADEIGELGTNINVMQKSIREIILAIKENAQQVSTASEEFSATSQQISANSEETSAQANVVSASTEQVNQNLQTVATATEQMSASISEIAKNAGEAAKVASQALTGGGRHEHGSDEARRVQRGNRAGDQSNYFDCAADEFIGAECHD